MAEQQRPTGLKVEAHQAVIALPVVEDGQALTFYYVDQNEVIAEESTPPEALNLTGAWADLDWQEAEEALDRIRHQSMPTPPIEL